MKISDKYNLRIFEILINPKGIINNREFLIVITLLMLCLFYHSTSGLFDFYRIFLNSGNYTKIAAIQATPNFFVVPSVSSFFIFVICIILCYKRSIDIGIKIYYGVISGLVIYFGLSFNFFEVFKSVSIYSIKSSDVINFSSNYMAFYNVLNFAFSSLTIFLIVYFSIKKGGKQIEYRKEYGYVLKLGKAHLFLLAFTLIISLFYYFTIEGNVNFGLRKSMAFIISFVILVFLVCYFLLNYKQSKNNIKLFYYNLIVFVALVCYFVAYQFFVKKTDSLILYKCAYSIFSILKMLFLMSNLSIISLVQNKVSK